MPHPIRCTVRPTAAGTALGAAAALTLLSACSSGGDTWAGVYDGRDDTPAPVATEPTPEDLLAQAAIDLEAAFANRQSPPQPVRQLEETAAAQPTAAEVPDPADDATEPAEPEVVTLQAPAEELEPEPAAPPPAPDVVIADLAGRIAQVLGDDLRPDEEPLRQAARLLALDLLSPGSAAPEIRALEEAMLPPQQEALNALRGLFQELADSSTLDQRRLADLLFQQIEALPRARPLRIADMRLCSEVTGFGQYTPMPTTFAAGSTHDAILYVEVENFKQRRFDSARDGWSGLTDPTAERWVTHLGQEVALLDDRNDHIALHEPEQIVRDIARQQRRDFYIVQRLHLPAQLAIGKYHLKVTLRDLAEGAAVAEKIIPIEIVQR